MFDCLCPFAGPEQDTKDCKHRQGVPETVLLLRLSDDGQHLDAEYPVLLLLLPTVLLHRLHHGLAVPAMLNHGCWLLKKVQLNRSLEQDFKLKFKDGMVKAG